MAQGYITQEKDYWIHQNALSITLNALGSPNRIQCSVSSGAVVMVFIDGDETLGYNAAHNYKSWPISASPTYFNSNTEKYVYVAIPRTETVGTQAVIVFPSEMLDINGINENDEQIGSTDYLYIWLGAVISATNGTTPREWTAVVRTGKLDTDQGRDEERKETDWYEWSSVTQTVTFLKKIVMSAGAWFQNIHLGDDDHNLTGVATASTSEEFVDSETLVVTPSYLSGKYLSKTHDDAAAGEIGFLNGLWIKAKGLFGFDEDGNIKANDIIAEGNSSVGGDADIAGNVSVGDKLDVYGVETVNDLKSRSYSGSGLADTGWSITNDNGSGSSQAVFDYLTIRKKMIINSIEIKETHFSAGDVAHTLAEAEIARTDFLYIDQDGNEELLGYSQVKVPWLLRGIALVLGKRNGGVDGVFSHYKKVRLTVTDAEIKRCNRIRCYFLSKDGDHEIENWFRPDDLVRCQTWNVVKEHRETFTPDFDDHTGNVYYWRKIKDVSYNTGVPRYVAKDAQGNPTNDTTTNVNQAYVNEGGIPRLATNGTYAQNVGYKHAQKVIDGNTYHWFDVEYDYYAEQRGATGSADAYSDIPAAGDKVVQFGNTTDPDRMNIYLIEVNGAGNPDAPDWKMYRGVYTFSLQNCWWGGESCCKTKWSVATGIEAYAPQFKWITEYGVARQVFTRQEVYWTEIALERDDFTNERSISSYPDYSDDIVDNNGSFVSRGGFKIVNGQKVYGSAQKPIPKNWVRKCRYYEQVTHQGSVWLCSMVESFYWRDSNGNHIASRQEGAEYVRSYTVQEPTSAANDWTEQVEKGDEGAFKSSVFCRTNKDISAYQPHGGTYDNPIPTSTKNAQGVVDSSIVWTDGIPAGDAMLWETTAWFYSNADPAPWTPPKKMSDNGSQDVEFCLLSSYTAIPENSPIGADRRDIGWYDPDRDKNRLPSGFTWSDMVWRAERRKQNGEYVGAWVYTRIKGENSVRIDLTNENDSMLYTSGGTLVSGNVTSEANLYDGSEDVSASATWTMTAVGCTLSSGNSRSIVVTGMTADTGYVSVQAVYTDKNGTQYTKVTRLTLKKLVDVDKYDLEITPNSIAYNSTKDSPATSTLSIKVWKSTVDGSRVVSDPPSGYGVYVNGTKQTKTATGTFSFTTDNSEYNSVLVKIAKTTDLNDILDSETIPITKAEDGAGGDTPMQAFKWNTSATTAPSLPSKGRYDNGWTATAPNRPSGSGEYHLWMTQAVKHTAANKNVTYDDWSPAVRISGDKGDAGADSADREWIYIGSTTYSSPYSGTHPKDITKDEDGVQRSSEYIHSHDDFVPLGWSDTAIATDDSSNKFVYASWRDKAKGASTWGDFNDPILWSNWGVQGIDGDGVQYVYKLFDHELTDAERTSNIPEKPASQTQGEWIPTGWSDDPLAPTSSLPFCYCSIIKKIGGEWSDTFEKLGLWSKWAKDADVWTIDADGYWCRNGQRYVTPDGEYVVAEGKNGTGVEMKGSCDVLFHSQIVGSQTALEDVTAAYGECYSVKSTGHLYFYDGTSQEENVPYGWVDVGEFKGDKGDNSYMHIAYAHSISQSGGTVVGVTGFTVNSDGSSYEWMGMCTDNNPLDPGAPGRDAGSDVANARFYKWNYMKGKDGSGVEYIYLLTKEDFKPTINSASYTGDHGDPTKDEFYPMVGNYQTGKIYGNSQYWEDDPPADVSETWPVLWWASRKFRNGAWEHFGDVTLHNRYTKDGSNAVKMDLDNEYDSILYDGTGTVKMSGNVTTKAYLFDGITDVSGSAAFTISNREGVDSSHATIRGRDVTVSGVTTDAVVTIRAEYPISSGIYYYAKFTVKKLLGIDKYDLVVTPNAIGVNTSNTVSDQPIAVKVKRTPGNGGDPSYVTFTNKTVNDYGLTLEVTDSRGNTLAETTGTGATTERTFNLTGSMAASVDNVTVLLKKGTSNVVQDVETIPVNQVHNGIDGSGSNAVKIDLDNEMDSIPCDSEGVVMSQTVLSTGARIYDGASPVTSGVTVKSVQQIAGVTAATSVAAGVVSISWTIAQGVNLTVDKFTAQIVLTLNSHDYYGTFTANVVKSGQPGVSPTVYQLSPDPSNIAFARDASGSLPTSPKTLEMKIKKTTGTSSEIITMAASGLTVRYRKDQTPVSSIDGTEFPAAGLDVYASDNNIYVAAFSGTTLIDREVIPVVKDGANGEPGGKATNMTPWFLALQGNTQPSVPAVNIVNDVPVSVIGSTSVSWHEGADPNWSDTYKWLFEIDHYFLDDGSSYWSSPYFSALWSEQGPAGNDAYEVILNPGYAIFEETWSQSEGMSVDVSQWAGSIQVVAGGTAKTFRVTYGNHSGCTLDTNGSTAANTSVSSATVKFGSIVASGSTGFPSEGYLVVNIATTDGKFSKSGFRVPFYLNKLGTFSRNITQGVEQAIGAITEYYPTDGSEPEKHSWLYDEVNTAKQHIRTIEQSSYFKLDTPSSQPSAFTFGFNISQADIDVYGNDFRLVIDFVDNSQTQNVSVLSGGTQKASFIVPAYASLDGLMTGLTAGIYSVTSSVSGQKIDHVSIYAKTDKYSSLKQTADGLQTQVNSKASTSALEQTASSILTTVSSKTQTNLFDCSDGEGWREWSNDSLCEYDSSTQKVISSDCYSTAVSLKAGVTYVLSFYCNTLPSVMPCECFGDPNADTANMGTLDEIEVTQMSETYLGKSRYKCLFTPSESGYYKFDVYDDGMALIYRPQIEVGNTPTSWVPGGTNQTSFIKQTADEVNIGIRNGLNSTGINITNRTINLQADKVTFSDSQGGNTDKIKIDPTTGTMQMVNAKITGATMSHKVKMFHSKEYTISNNTATGKDTDYYLYQWDGVSVPDSSKPYYKEPVGLSMICDHLFVVAVGAEASEASRVNRHSVLRINLPPAHEFIGQRILITNETIGYPDENVLLVQDYYKMLSGTTSGSNNVLVLTDNKFMAGGSYPGTTYDANGEGVPFASINTISGEEASGWDAKIFMTSGLWKAYEGGAYASNPYSYMSEIENEIAIGQYAWVELTAVEGIFKGITYTSSNKNWSDAAIEYNAIWMLSRWELR